MAKPVTQGQVIRSEWIKLRTVRSSWFVLGATVLALPQKLGWNSLRPTHRP